MPFPWVPGEAFNESGFKNLEVGGFGVSGEVSDHLERGSMFILNKDPDRVITLGREGYLLGVLNPDEPAVGNPAVFNGLHQVGGNSNHLVNSGGGAGAREFLRPCC